jgi:hypothetical protein
MGNVRKIIILTMIIPWYFPRRTKENDRYDLRQRNQVISVKILKKETASFSDVGNLCNINTLLNPGDPRNNMNQCKKFK